MNVGDVVILEETLQRPESEEVIDRRTGDLLFLVERHGRMTTQQAL